MNILTVSDLSVRIGRREIVRGVSLAVEPEQTVGIVGESGSGKSMTVLAATGLLDAPGAVVNGSSVLAGEQELIGASARTLRGVHGGRIGFVFQDPGTSLNPLLTVERQITESLETHRRMTRRAARQRALELLTAVGLPDPQKRLQSYPHQLSGGQRQRVMVAIALSCDPGLLVADEPTTALDVTTQAQIIDLVRELQRDFGTAVIWISHDLGVIGEVADTVTVLRDGSVVEQGTIDQIFDAPGQDYTRELLAARPLLDGTGPPEPAADTDVLLDVRGLAVRYGGVRAVDDVSFQIRRGTTLGLVGESGSGKSTVAAALTGLVKPDAGSAVLGGIDVLARKADRRRIGMVFQDPFASLNPRMAVGVSIAEPLVVHRLVDGRAQRRARVAELLEMVGLDADFAGRYPHELSGGQRQRISIARALAAEPDLLILDEATAALDVSVQATVLELLARLQRELELTYLFIGHDLAVIERMSHDVLVLQGGRTVEYRSADELFSAPEQDYTRALLAAVPPARPTRS
ncbi:MAG: ABC transporter ATP-binding protein [Mycolicibacterium neoaurum]|uniref:ABC transporter ATP-binding protein n=1 Tax=Mycolicibacterium neoaurum TaxID=1795 RepID=UPI002FF80FE3